MFKKNNGCDFKIIKLMKQRFEKLFFVIILKQLLNMYRG